MSKPSFFLSFPMRDAELASQVESALAHLGFEAFNPARELRAGENWRKAVHAAIKKSDAVIMLATSPQHLSSSWTSYEVGMAEALGKPIMILLSDKHSVSELPAELASEHVVALDLEGVLHSAREIAARLALTE